MGLTRVDWIPPARVDAGSAIGDEALRALARARPDLAWSEGADIATARNFHATDTRRQLEDGLRSDANWLEGDIRLDGAGTAVLRHLSRDRVELTLDHWLDIVGPSGRGIKLDIKDPAAVPAVIAALRAASIPQHRLIINVGAWPAHTLLTIRQAFPDAIINLTPTATSDITATEIVQLQLAARIVGGPIMFPIRQDLVNEGIIHALKPLGRIAVWNSPSLTAPGPDTARQLRELGVDGMIDLRSPSTLRERIESTFITCVAAIVGWNAVHDALDAAGLR